MNNKPIAIIGAMSQEVEALKTRLKNLETIELAGMTIYNGFLDGVYVVVMQCGIGKVNAAIGTTLLMEKFSPHVVINTGSAGGIGAGLSVGDIVVGATVAHHDVDVTAFGYAIGQMAQMPASYDCDKTLGKMAHHAAHAFPDAMIHHGQIVSGDQFIADSARFAAIKQHFPTALAVEMEAAAIAQVCYRFDVPFVVVRAISDLADEDAGVSFDAFIEQAGKHSAEMVIEMIKELA